MVRSRLLRLTLLAFLGFGGTVVPLAALAIRAAHAEPEASSLAVQAAKLALAGKFVEAGTTAERSKDPAAAKLVELIYLRDQSKEAGYARIMNFLDAAPNWPLSEALIKRAERTLYTNNEPAAVILGHFANRKPQTPEGALALARAMLAKGDAATAALLVRGAWNDPNLDADLEKQAGSEFKALLGPEDYRSRMWRLIYAGEGAAAVRAARGLGSDYQKAASVAKELLRGPAGADKLFGKLPPAMRNQLPMKYALVRYYRRANRWDEARAILVGIPSDPSVLGDVNAWWAERRIIARHSVGPTHPGAAKAAYQIARSHGFSSGEGAIEGEFLAGWVALRSLNDPAKALGHFQKLDTLAGTSTEKARAKYWLGRTFTALKRPADAKSAYREASQYSTIYYGQLAREQIGLGKVPEEISSGTPSPAAQAKIDRDEVVRAFAIMAKAGGKNDLYMFPWSFANRFDTTDEMNAAATVAWNAGGPTLAVRLAKAAELRDIDIGSWSYPVKALPDWKQVGKPVERALVFALSRQESEFNPMAGSSVGAQGLMQIMPATARLIAKRYGLSYRNGMLTGDPSYNVKLGAAHLGDLIDDYGGSYVLTLVAYNAGPRRSREWVAEYGDLRDGKVDPIDWVESIPFQETRQYVQKVLQNIHVYRSRLAPATVRPMSADLGRGSATPIKVAASADDRRASPNCNGGSIADLISACE